MVKENRLMNIINGSKYKSLKWEIPNDMKETRPREKHERMQ